MEPLKLLAELLDFCKRYLLKRYVFGAASRLLHLTGAYTIRWDSTPAPSERPEGTAAFIRHGVTPWTALRPRGTGYRELADSSTRFYSARLAFHKAKPTSRERIQAAWREAARSTYSMSDSETPNSITKESMSSPDQKGSRTSLTRAAP